MQIVINISEEQYEIIKELVRKQNKVCPEADSAEKIILNGTPLPKGHGRLIDENDLWFEDIDDISCITQRNVENTPTIIESESEEQ